MMANHKQLTHNKNKKARKVSTLARAFNSFTRNNEVKPL